MGAFLALFGWRSYLLFHSLAEVFSISIAAGVFMFAWSSRGYHETSKLVYLGTGLVFTALIDLFHTLTYRGMGIFDPSSDLATQLWIAGRYLQVLTFLFFAVSIGRRQSCRTGFSSPSPRPLPCSSSPASSTATFSRCVSSTGRGSRRSSG